MVRLALAVVVAFAGAAFVAACGTIAGLGDYELAPDASGADAGAEGSAGEAGPDVDAAGGDTGGGDDGGDAYAPGDSGDGSVDAPSVVDTGVVDSGGPVVPPSDKGHVACGADTCDLPGEECCHGPDASTCQQAMGGGNCDGVVQHCDESANCLFQVCCVTSTSATGLETECRQSCQGSDPQSCRTDSECGSMGPCVAWLCGGRVVATCGGAGSAAGCH